TAAAANTARQPNGTISAEPARGASIGDTLRTSITVDISRVASTPVWRSRITALGTTMTEAAPTPWIKRNAISQPMLGDRPEPTAPTMKRPKPTYSGGLRPLMSDAGP